MSGPEEGQAYPSTAGVRLGQGPRAKATERLHTYLSDTLTEKRSAANAPKAVTGQDQTLDPLAPAHGAQG